MHPISIIVAALAASAAAFDPDEALAHPQMKRALLEPRQTGLGGALGGLSDLSPSCTSALLGLYTSLPTPPANLGQALRGNGGNGGGGGGGGGGDGGGGNNPCSANLPSSLSSDFSSYSSDVRSWFDDNSAEVSSVFSSCSQISRYESLLPVCVSSFIGGAAAGGNSASTTATATATTTDTSSGGSGASSSSTGSSGSESTSGSAGGSDSSGAGAPREAGVAMMALVAVGVFAAAL